LWLLAAAAVVRVVRVKPTIKLQAAKAVAQLAKQEQAHHLQMLAELEVPKLLVEMAALHGVAAKLVLSEQ
jgi:malic enzyme